MAKLIQEDYTDEDIEHDMKAVLWDTAYLKVEQAEEQAKKAQLALL